MGDCRCLYQRLFLRTSWTECVFLFLTPVSFCKMRLVCNQPARAWAPPDTWPAAPVAAASNGAAFLCGAARMPYGGSATRLRSAKYRRRRWRRRLPASGAIPPTDGGRIAAVGGIFASFGGSRLPAVGGARPPSPTAWRCGLRRRCYFVGGRYSPCHPAGSATLAPLSTVFTLSNCTHTPEIPPAHMLPGMLPVWCALFKTGSAYSNTWSLTRWPLI